MSIGMIFSPLRTYVQQRFDGESFNDVEGVSVPFPLFKVTPMTNRENQQLKTLPRMISDRTGDSIDFNMLRYRV